MKQMSLGAAGFERKTKRTRKREFLDEMNLVVPWSELVALVTPHAPTRGAKGGRPPFPVVTLPLFGVALSPTITRPFFAVPRTSVARTASG